MSPVNDPATVAAVTAAFEAYEAALIANDVAALQAFFWDSPASVRFGTDEQLYGIEAINAFRSERVINFSHRQGRRTCLTTFGDSAASVMYEYSARFDGIERHGRQSQTWIRFPEGWRIVAAHVSRTPTPANEATDWSAYATHASAVQGLSIDPAYLAGVASHLSIMAALAAPLLRFELPAHTEPAPVFAP